MIVTINNKLASTNSNSSSNDGSNVSYNGSYNGSYNVSYNVIIQKYSLDYLEKYIDVNKNTLIVTDDIVCSLHLNKVLKQIKNAKVYIIKHGEENKSLEVVNDILRYLLENEFSRSDQIIALGGGIVGDLTGFVSSIYKRGVDFINIPTTTLSMIDSSVGGKTGVNLGIYKNMVGSFYTPKIVIIDEQVLNTLPKRHFYNGMVEALKMGLTLDRKLYNLFLEENFEENISLIIEKSVIAKKNVVEQDFKETGLRKVLNFAHTVGHAIESNSFITNNELFHGECVACGMYYVIKNQKLKDEVITILNKMQIDILKIIKNINNLELINLIKNDKKRNSETIDFVFLNDIEDFEFLKIPLKDIIKILEA